MKKNKGFTLIELLVVIAIIGILASVVLAALSSARAKGADAAVKSNLANARAQAELFYDSNGNVYYGGTALTDVCDTAGLATGNVKSINTMLVGAASATGATVQTQAIGAYNKATCNSVGGSTSAWAAEAPLKASTAATPSMWCVDSTGKSKAEPAPLATATTTNCS